MRPSRAEARCRPYAGAVRIRRAGPGDDAAIDDVEGTAFGARGDVVVSLVHELRRTGAARAELVADDAGRLAGHVLLSRGWIDAAPRLVEVLVLSPLAVAPAAQRRGVGGALVAAALATAAARSAPAVFLEGDPAYYARFGFAAARPLGFLPPSERIPDAGFQVHLLDGHEPWMTGPLVYPDAFWTMDCVGLR